MAQNNNSEEYSRTIVAVRFSALGDVAMTLPVLYSAARSNPDCRFVFLTRPLFAKFALNAPSNLIVRGIDLKEKYAGIKGMAKLTGEIIREFHPDCLADLHDVLRTKILRFGFGISGIRTVKIDKGRAEKKALTREKDKISKQLKPMILRYEEVLRKAGVEPGDSFRSLFDTTSPDPALFSAVTQDRAEGEKWIGIAPFAKHAGKIYPPEKMEEVVAALSAIRTVRIFLFGGGPGETEILSEWEEKYPRVISLADKKAGFAAELTLMGRLDAMVSMDSGNMHLASLAGTPVISIWGATHPYAGFMGFRQKEEDIIQTDLPCRPCSVFGDKKCMYGTYRCMNDIAPATIIAGVMQKIAD